MLRKLQHNDRFIVNKSYLPQIDSQSYDNLVCDKYEKLLYREMIVNNHQNINIDNQILSMISPKN